MFDILLHNPAVNREKNKSVDPGYLQGYKVYKVVVTFEFLSLTKYSIIMLFRINIGSCVSRFSNTVTFSMSI